MRLVLAAVSDIYRLGAALFDWRGNWRRVNGKSQLDVACITNFETPYQKNFIGLGNKEYADGLRYSINGTLGRYILINSDAQGMMRSQGRTVAKQQLKDAIAYSSLKGARVILFAAATKRLLSETELAHIQIEYPQITFTIGDNGTVLLLLADIKHTIERYKVRKEEGVLLIGPNGFLGSAVKNRLLKEGYSNIYTASYKDEKPFDEASNIRLIVACSHHNKLRLKQKLLARIASAKGVLVVDVCKPDNLTDAEYRKCIKSGQKLIKIRSGMVFNRGLKYTFEIAARVVLEQLSLRPRMLYACFGEATILAQEGNNFHHSKFNFMDTNALAMDHISTGFQNAKYSLVSRVHNNQEKASIEIRDLSGKINLRDGRKVGSK